MTAAPTGPAELAAPERPPDPPPAGDGNPGTAEAAELAQVLAFERQWWRRAGAKEQAIRDTFGLSPTRYYQRLNRLLDAPAALAQDPVLVSRLRRLRTSRTRPLT